MVWSRDLSFDQDVGYGHVFTSQQFISHFCTSMTWYWWLLHVLVEAKLECYSDNDCAYSEVCHQGTCVDACLVTKCGANARCESRQHSAQCICLPGYTGNPQHACSLCEFSQEFVSHLCSLIFACFPFFTLPVGLPTLPVVSVGCESNDDCPDYTSCRNRKCINPCAVDKPCAPSALCKVVNHNPVCTCPNGYIGSPHTKCTPRKFCTKYCTKLTQRMYTLHTTHSHSGI